MRELYRQTNSIYNIVQWFRQFYWDVSTYKTEPFHAAPPSRFYISPFLLCYTVLYCTVSYWITYVCSFIVFYMNCTVLYSILLYCTVLYCTVLYCDVLYCTVLYCTILYCTILYCIVLQYSVLTCTVLYSTLLYSNLT